MTQQINREIARLRQEALRHDDRARQAGLYMIEYSHHPVTVGEMRALRNEHERAARACRDKIAGLRRRRQALRKPDGPIDVAGIL